MPTRYYQQEHRLTAEERRRLRMLEDMRGITTGVRSQRVQYDPTSAGRATAEELASRLIPAEQPSAEAVSATFPSVSSPGDTSRKLTLDTTAPGFYSVGFSGEKPLQGNAYSPGDPLFMDPAAQQRERAGLEQRRFENRGEFDERETLREALRFQRTQAREARRDARMRGLDQIYLEQRRAQLAGQHPGLLPAPSAPPESNIPVSGAEGIASALEPAYGAPGSRTPYVAEAGGIPLTTAQYIDLITSQDVGERVRRGQDLTASGRELAAQTGRERSLQTATTADIATAMNLVGVSDYTNVEAASWTTPSGETLQGLSALEAAIEAVMDLRMGHVSALGGSGSAGLEDDEQILAQLLGE